MLLHAALISVFLIIWLVESEVDEEDEQLEVEPEYTEVLLDDDFDENDPLFFDDAFDEPLDEEEEEDEEELSVTEEPEDREDEEEDRNHVDGVHGDVVLVHSRSASQ